MEKNFPSLYIRLSKSQNYVTITYIYKIGSMYYVDMHTHSIVFTVDGTSGILDYAVHYMLSTSLVIRNTM